MLIGQKIVSKTEIINQFILLCKSKYYLSNRIIEEIKKQLRHNFPYIVNDWIEKFYKDIFFSRYGYSLQNVFQKPYSEKIIDQYLNENISKNLKLKYHYPGICLTHDIDHLSTNLKLYIKNILSEKQIIYKHENYLYSLEKILKLNARVSEKKKSSNLFVSMPIKPKKIYYHPIAWILDPSYDDSNYLFKDLKKLIIKYQTCVGLHGSFFSLKEDYLGLEKEKLEKALKININFSRQHWLNLPTQEAFEIIKKEKFLIDSTLGWNGNCGFRGGMARPFPILLKNKKVQWELPLILMDGPLFHNMNMNDKEILNFSLKLLSYVKKHNGLVSINWHERSASKRYKNWFDVYKKIILNLKSQNFKFFNLEEIVKKNEKNCFK